MRYFLKFILLNFYSFGYVVGKYSVDLSPGLVTSFFPTVF